MFPMIPGIPAYQASVLGSQKAFDGKGNSSKGAADLDTKFSSDFAKHSAIRILYDVKNFVRSPQTYPEDVKALRRFNL